MWHTLLVSASDYVTDLRPDTPTSKMLPIMQAFHSGRNSAFVGKRAICCRYVFATTAGDLVRRAMVGENSSWSIPYVGTQAPLRFVVTAPTVNHAGLVVRSDRLRRPDSLARKSSTRFYRPNAFAAWR
jgi:hypothetical protein